MHPELHAQQSLKGSALSIGQNPELSCAGVSKLRSKGAAGERCSSGSVSAEAHRLQVTPTAAKTAAKPEG